MKVSAEMTLPFWVNNYIDPLGRSNTVCNPHLSREDCDAQRIRTWRVNCRLKVVSLASHSKEGEQG